MGKKFEEISLDECIVIEGGVVVPAGPIFVIAGALWAGHQLYQVGKDLGEFIYHATH